jgi:hypothetical protein
MTMDRLRPLIRFCSALVRIDIAMSLAMTAMLLLVLRGR